MLWLRTPVSSGLGGCPGLAVFLGQGDGTFEAPQVLPDIQPVPLAGLGDINSDGAVDLISGSSVLLQGFELPALTPPPFSYFPGSLVIDLEGDGDLDVLRLPGIGEPSLLLGIWPSDGSGFTAPVSTLASGLFSSPESLIGGQDALGDLDGDGQVEFVARRVQGFGPGSVELGLWSYGYQP